MHGGRQACQKLRQLLLDLVDGLDDVGARLALDVQHDGGGAVEPGPLLDVLGGPLHRGHVAQQDRRAVLVGNHRVEIVLGIGDLVVVVDRVVELGPVEIALRLAERNEPQQRAQIVDVEAVGGELLRIGLDPDRGDIAARRRDQTDTRDFGDLRGEAVVGDVLQLGERHPLGRHRQGQDRPVGRIDLGVGRRRRQAGRQQAVGGVDRLLNVLLGDIEVHRQVELQGDDRGRRGTRRDHLL